MVDICGPAKLTLLESNAVYTIALNSAAFTYGSPIPRNSTSSRHS